MGSKKSYDPRKFHDTPSALNAQGERDEMSGQSHTGKLLQHWMNQGRGLTAKEIGRGLQSCIATTSVFPYRHTPNIPWVRGHFLTQRTVEGLKKTFSVSERESKELDTALARDCSEWRDSLLATMRAPENAEVFLTVLGLYRGRASAVSLLEEVYRELRPSMPIYSFTNTQLRHLREGEPLPPEVTAAIDRLFPLPPGISPPPPLTLTPGPPLPEGEEQGPAELLQGPPPGGRRGR